jgi:hypothetical protein
MVNEEEEGGKEINGGWMDKWRGKGIVRGESQETSV